VGQIATHIFKSRLFMLKKNDKILMITLPAEADGTLFLMVSFLTIFFKWIRIKGECIFGKYFFSFAGDQMSLLSPFVEHI
jgi:hypothetical protein